MLVKKKTQENLDPYKMGILMNEWHICQDFFLIAIKSWPWGIEY